MPPTYANGKICYLELPATDIARSADFYHQVFHWTIRKRGDGSTAFDDTTGQVSGAFVLGRPPAAKPGLLFYIMCDSVAATLDAILAHQGEVVQPSLADIVRSRHLDLDRLNQRSGVSSERIAAIMQGADPSLAELRKLRSEERRVGKECGWS